MPLRFQRALISWLPPDRNAACAVSREPIFIKLAHVLKGAAAAILKDTPHCSIAGLRVAVKARPAISMEKVHFLTLGCPKNVADSELMLGALCAAGFEVTLDPEEAQVLVVNTCAFIEAAKKESIAAILDAAQVKRNRLGRRLVVAGCMAQRYGTELREEMPEVDVFVGTGNFLELPELLRRTEDVEARPMPYTGAAHLLAKASAPRIRTGAFFTSYLKISEGCNHKCAFCIIPKIRGPHESPLPGDVLAEAQALAASGVREINLIAQDLTAYGRDFGRPLRWRSCFEA